MAKRHFDKNGFPKLNNILSEIRRYVSGLEVEYTDFPFAGNVIDPRNTRYGDRFVCLDVAFVQGIQKKPFKVQGVYVVGGQVAYLPDSYNTGEHDLDMVVRTNANQVTFSLDVQTAILLNLNKILNNGKEDSDTKAFVLDMFEDIEIPLTSPYLQVYPEIKKVEK